MGLPCVIVMMFHALFNGQCHDKCRPLAVVTFRYDRASVAVDDFPHHGQSDATHEAAAIRNQIETHRYDKSLFS